MLEDLGYKDLELVDVEEDFVLNHNIEFKPFMAKVVPMEKYKAHIFDEDGLTPITYELPPVFAGYVKGEPQAIVTIVATWWHGGKLWANSEWKDIYKMNFTEEELEKANSIIMTIVSDGWG